MGKTLFFFPPGMGKNEKAGEKSRLFQTLPKKIKGANDYSWAGCGSATEMVSTTWETFPVASFIV